MQDPGVDLDPITQWRTAVMNQAVIRTTTDNQPVRVYTHCDNGHEIIILNAQWWYKNKYVHLVHNVQDDTYVIRGVSDAQQWDSVVSQLHISCLHNDEYALACDLEMLISFPKHNNVTFNS